MRSQHEGRKILRRWSSKRTNRDRGNRPTYGVVEGKAQHNCSQKGGKKKESVGKMPEKDGAERKVVQILT